MLFTLGTLRHTFYLWSFEILLSSIYYFTIISPKGSSCQAVANEKSYIHNYAITPKQTTSQPTMIINNKYNAMMGRSQQRSEQYNSNCCSNYANTPKQGVPERHVSSQGNPHQRSGERFGGSASG